MPEMQKNATQYDHELGKPHYQDDLLQTILNTHKITADTAAVFSRCYWVALHLRCSIS